MTGERYVHAIFPNAVAQGEVVGLNIVGIDTAYPGAESMNSLKHLVIPIVSIGAMDGDDVLRWKDGQAMRTVWPTAGRIVGCRLAGEIAGAGAYRTLMLRGDDVRRYGKQLVDPRFGLGAVALRTVLPALSA
ncbi:MAG TPA: hypothetical protein VIJ41_12370 [Candidatus Nanopelagicales bacterium]